MTEITKKAVFPDYKTWFPIRYPTFDNTVKAQINSFVYKVVKDDKPSLGPISKLKYEKFFNGLLGKWEDKQRLGSLKAKDISRIRRFEYYVSNALPIVEGLASEKKIKRNVHMGYFHLTLTSFQERSRSLIPSIVLCFIVAGVSRLMQKQDSA